MEASTVPGLAPVGATGSASPTLLRLASDTHLVALVREGRAAAFETVYDRHHRAILSFCRHMLGDAEEAQDAVQHTFLAAYNDLIASDKAIHLRAWLFTIARNRCYSVLRARREQPAADLVDGATEGLATQVQRRQDLRDLIVDMRRLPDDQRAALVLAELDALTHEEIGGVLGVPREKVKALVFQARESLVASRAARDTDCAEIREQLASLHGGGLRRGNIRRHLRECSGCREFRTQIDRQRHRLAIVLPAATTVALRNAVLSGAAGTTAGVAATRGGGLVATWALKGGIVKGVLGVLVAGVGTAGIVAARELPFGSGDARAHARPPAHSASHTRIPIRATAGTRRVLSDAAVGYGRVLSDATVGNGRVLSAATTGNRRVLSGRSGSLARGHQARPRAAGQIEPFGAPVPRSPRNVHRSRHARSVALGRFNLAFPGGARVRIKVLQPGASSSSRSPVVAPVIASPLASATQDAGGSDPDPVDGIVPGEGLGDTNLNRVVIGGAGTVGNAHGSINSGSTTGPGGGAPGSTPGATGTSGPGSTLGATGTSSPGSTPGATGSSGPGSTSGGSGTSAAPTTSGGSGSSTPGGPPGGLGSGALGSTSGRSAWNPGSAEDATSDVAVGYGHASARSLTGGAGAPTVDGGRSAEGRVDSSSRAAVDAAVHSSLPSRN